MFGNKINVNITSSGRPHLSAAVGSEKFTREYVKSKVNEWSSTISLLSKISLSQPHAAYAALTHGLLSKWSYLSHIIPMLEKSFPFGRRLEITADTCTHQSTSTK